MPAGPRLVINWRGAVAVVGGERFLESLYLRPAGDLQGKQRFLEGVTHRIGQRRAGKIEKGF